MMLEDSNIEAFHAWYDKSDSFGIHLVALLCTDSMLLQSVT